MTEREYKDFIKNLIDFPDHPRKYLINDKKINNCESLMLSMDLFDYKS
jgi:hypothetical protein